MGDIFEYYRARVLKQQLIFGWDKDSSDVVNTYGHPQSTYFATQI